ncbi:hypothetical protein VNO77_32098 [Canavalia gladiata]|uniref:Uncharacterized protein n=1 Tax=Canavalia gladiata TaxID=3824 RepID=A0AAN9KPK0_CANGL
MGTCLSKKKGSSTSTSNSAPSQQKDSEKSVVEPEEVSLRKEEEEEEEEVREDETQVKKEIFIMKHRKSHDDKNRERDSKSPPCIDGNEEEAMMGNKKIEASTTNMVVGVRTSSCTKEEVDAILIQCGRLSRSSSAKGRKYSGSKRSFDFDHCDNDAVSPNATDNSEENASEKGHQHRSRHRQSPRRRSSPSSQGRRRTPSREREQQHQQQCSSSSRERRVSRSPGRRSSETTSSNVNASNNTGSARPGKMVSVPPTVSSLVMDKSNNCGGGESGIKRATVKRNGGGGGGDGGVVVGSRGAASPRAQSPARANGNVVNAKVLTENQQQQPSLSRNNSSRKAEQSPYRRNPLGEVDPNSLPYPQSNTNNAKVVQNKPKIEPQANQKPNGKVALEKGVSVESKTKGQQHEEEIKIMSSVPSGVENLKPQNLTRSRSSRRSRDLDINPEAVMNPTHSYTSLLLEDIQNFHQKNTQQQQPSISLPACLTKACSILEAVADLNSTTSSNLSGGFSEDRRSPSTQQSNRNEHNVLRMAGSKDPFIESEVVVSDDVMEPSLHKYVTVKRGGSLCGVDMEDQESSGSNSFTVSSSGQHQWGISSSSWEPNSADSTDCWTSSLSSEAKKKSLNNKKRECDHEHSSGIGRGRLGSNKGSHTLPVATSAATT